METVLFLTVHSGTTCLSANIASRENTNTLLCATYIQGMITLWEGMKTKLPAYYFIIDAGIDKLEDYHEQTSLSPAYKLAMGD